MAILFYRSRHHCYEVCDLITRIHHQVSFCMISFSFFVAAVISSWPCARYWHSLSPSINLLSSEQTRKSSFPTFFLHSFPSFPLKLGTQGSWPTSLIPSKGMSGAHSGACICVDPPLLQSNLEGKLSAAKPCSTYRHTHTHTDPCTFILARTFNEVM